MTEKKYVAKLLQYAGRTHSKLEFQTISERPADKHVTIKAVIDGEEFIGVGSTPRRAKENAAKNALRSLSDKENHGRTTKNASKNPDVPVHQKNQPTTKPGQKNILSIRLPANGEKEGATGTAKRKVKKKLVYDEACDSKTEEVPSAAVLSDNGVSTPQSSSQFSLECHDALSESVAKTPDLSNHSIVQDGSSLEDIHASEIQSARSQNIKSNREFVHKKQLGKGGFGYVFKATDTLLRKDYAIKKVPWKKKALREAEAMANLHHENIVQFFTCWVEESRHQSDNSGNSSSSSPSSVSSSGSCLYIQMELCDNDTLREWIDNTNEIESLVAKRRRESLDFMLEIVSGVEYIHSKKYIHRDLKPGNIFFGLDGKVKIGDFGLVTVEHDQDQRERSVDKGTPSYMAPEQKSELKYDRKVDIFSLGLINFELVWKISSYHERGRIWGDVRAQNLPDRFSDSFSEEHCIIIQMLSEKPEDRPDASQVKEVLVKHSQIINT